MATKVCPKCGYEKDTGEFYKNKTSRDGLQSQCKECLRAYHESHREQNRARSRAWREKHGQSSRRRRVRRRGGPGTLFPQLGDE